MDILTNCVNPYDVNPIVDTTGNFCQQQKLQKNIKVEMEEFRDLEPYLPDTIPKNSVDELNTPIFDKEGPFDFTINENSAALIGDPFTFDSNHVAFETNNLTSNYLNNISLEQENSETATNMQNSPSEASPNEFIIETPSTVRSEDQTSAAFKYEDCSVLSEHYSNASSPCDDHGYYLNQINSTSTNEQYSNLPSPNETYVIEHHNNLGIDTPDDSNSSDNVSIITIPKLLTFSHTSNNVLNTPDVIDTVVSLDETFNILDFVNAKDLASVKLEDIRFELPSTSQEASSNLSKRKRAPKRRYNDDDDDYIPPSSKKSHMSSDSDYDDDDDYDYEVKKKSRRGRPSMYPDKISDFSVIGKYRELRDKNNEASRRSRLKRKIKEQSLEEEADQLEEKNIKLKARVSELERMVNNFRSNLFKIMLKK